jgi:hypothetical protein
MRCLGWSNLTVTLALLIAISAGQDALAANGDQSPAIFKDITGLGVPQMMGIDEVAATLKDPFAQLVLPDAVLPDTVHEVLAALDAHNDDAQGVPVQEVYLVSESGQILVNTQSQELKRRERAVITRTRGQNAIVMIAPSTRDPLLEVIAWDADKKAFNYYVREGQRTWLWKGDSTHALQAQTHGQGCFTCHINGAPIMKELLVPWTNWQSQAATIKPEAIPDDSPLKHDPLFTPANLTGAEQLERHIQAWVSRTNQGHVERLRQGQMTVRTALRPLVQTTTANLAFSTEPSASNGPRIPIPLSFFVNAQGFARAGVDIDVPEAFGNCNPFCQPAVDRAIYEAALVRFEFALQAPVNFVQRPGDTHFAFAIPAPAFEDMDMMQQLIGQGIVSRRFAACMLAVDFPNPVYSPERQQLLSFIPDATLADVGDVPTAVAQAMAQRAAALPEGDAERVALDAFLSCWKVPEQTWTEVLQSHIDAYLKQVAQHLNTMSGFFDYVKLAEARRLQFTLSPHGKLKESDLLFPVSKALDGIADPQRLRMTSDGSIAIPHAP